MKKSVAKKYKRAGKIAKEIRKEAYDRLKPGLKILDLIEELENKIRKKAAIAFPINVAIDDEAAHATPKAGDKSVLEKGQVVKVDVGVHVDGYIADTAVTKEIGTKKHQDLIKASENAFEAALNLIKEGERELNKIGKAVQTEITKKGFSPIKNLSGHQLKKYDLHAGINIPNFETMKGKKLKNGMAVAIEPFATTGAGFVKEGKKSQIYRIKQKKSVRMGKDVLKMMSKKEGLPFAKRWLLKKLNKAEVEIGLKKLVSANSIKRFPVLREKNKGLVSQKEHTILIEENPIITTM